MGRPQVISRDQILTAAREVFLREGAAASTASIAKLAGVSEGSIFKRFATKEALFRAALGLPEVQVVEALQKIFEKPTLEDRLEGAGLWLIELFRELLPRMMMLWANHASKHDDPFEVMRCIGGATPMPLVLLRALSHQLELQQRQGELRALDPEILARVLIGSMHNFVFFDLVGLHVRQPLAATSFVRGVVQLALEGARSSAGQEDLNE